MGLPFDNPGACLYGDGKDGTRCTSGDLLLNPAAQGSEMWGAGKFVRSSVARFTGRRPRNPSPCLTEPAVFSEDCSGVLFGQGLRNPLTAEIHFILRDNGPKQDGVDDQTSEVFGGCRPVEEVGAPAYPPGWGTPGDFVCYESQTTMVPERPPALVPEG